MKLRKGVHTEDRGCLCNCKLMWMEGQLVDQDKMYRLHLENVQKQKREEDEERKESADFSWTDKK